MGPLWISDKPTFIMRHQSHSYPPPSKSKTPQHEDQTKYLCSHSFSTRCPASKSPSNAKVLPYFLQDIDWWNRPGVQERSSQHFAEEANGSQESRERLLPKTYPELICSTTSTVTTLGHTIVFFHLENRNNLIIIFWYSCPQYQISIFPSDS